MIRAVLVVALLASCAGCALDDIEDELRATRREMELQRQSAQAAPTAWPTATPQ